MPNYKQPSYSKSSSNKGSPSSPFKGCKDYDECNKVAVDRLKDAVALLKDGQYIGALYMAGYVIEIATKAEFHRLAEKPVSLLICQDKIAKHIVGIGKEAKKAETAAEKKQKTEEELELKNYCHNIWVLNRDNGTLKTILSKFPKKFNEKPTCAVIIENQYPKHSKNPTSHNLDGFVLELKGWKDVFGESEVNPDYCKFMEHFHWSANLRYSIDTTKTNDKTLAVDPATVNVATAVTTSFFFLKEVLGIADKPLLEIGGKLLEIMEKLKLPSLVAKLKSINKDVHKSESEYIMSNEVKNEVNKNV